MTNTSQELNKIDAPTPINNVSRKKLEAEDRDKVAGVVDMVTNGIVKAEDLLVLTQEQQYAIKKYADSIVEVQQERSDYKKLVLQEHSVDEGIDLIKETLPKKFAILKKQIKSAEKKVAHYEKRLDAHLDKYNDEDEEAWELKKKSYEDAIDEYTKVCLDGYNAIEKSQLAVTKSPLAKESMQITNTTNIANQNGESPERKTVKDVNGTIVSNKPVRPKRESVEELDSLIEG